MCGIVGFIGTYNPDRLYDTCSNMTNMLHHRGPDDRGIWIDKENGVAFGHTRLSIQDTSIAGAQPMISKDNRWVIVFNGEVYNFQELSVELRESGIRLHGHSDTEVLLELIATQGLFTALDKIIGMFAFALWDKYKKQLFLVRDRMGIKPLYWGISESLFLFGSEIKALLAHPGWVPKLNQSTVNTFLQLSYIPAPLSILQNINKLQPGELVQWSKSTGPSTKKYWNLDTCFNSSLSTASETYSDQETLEELSTLLESSIRYRTRADVPVGAFLSGGVDSTLVTAIMQSQSSVPIQTFTIGFENRNFDESSHAQRVASYLGTNHNSIKTSTEDLCSLIPNLATTYDEPFADSSQLPTQLVSILTRQSVKVALSGDGGDELFGGYERYRWARFIQILRDKLPNRFRNVASSSLSRIAPHIARKMNHFLPPRYRMAHLSNKLDKLSRSLLAENDQGIYHKLISNYYPFIGELNDNLPFPWYSPIKCPPETRLFQNMRYLDMLTYLPDDILTKVDRASMSCGLEVRVPILDHRIVEFACRQPANMLIRNHETKWLLRRLLDQYIPPNILERPKMGFSVPIDDWLRNRLKTWAQDIIFDRTSLEYTFIDSQNLRLMWKAHQDKSSDLGTSLWTILMLFCWLETYNIQ